VVASLLCGFIVHKNGSVASTLGSLRSLWLNRFLLGACANGRLLTDAQILLHSPPFVKLQIQAQSGLQLPLPTRPSLDFAAAQGPDNLWCIRAGQYLLVECKSEVDLNRAEINKDESGQMNNSCAWFDKYYKGATVTRVLIIPANKVSRAAGFVQEVGIVREKSLRNLRRNVRAFFSEFKSTDFASLSPAKVQEYLENHHLSEDAILAEYSEKVRP
jgi:hypothetical protein